MDLSPRLAHLPAVALDGLELRVRCAASPLARLRGLAFLDPIPPDTGLLLPRTRSVHTLGMRFALDLVWLDGAGRVLRIDRDVAPRRLRGHRGARHVLELSAGAAGPWTGCALW